MAGSSLAGTGCVVASVNYRQSGEAASPAAARDIRSALRWLRANATRYSLDKQRVGIWGVSLAASLQALQATIAFFDQQLLARTGR